MDSDGLPIVGAGVDYVKVGPFHQKRTLTFLNHFLTHTTSFLNHFSAICDEKLENLLGRIQRLEASMCILEAKLTSIPGLDEVSLDKESSIAETKDSQPAANVQVPEPVAQPQHSDIPAETSEEKKKEPEKPVIKMSQDPRYSKYFKMVNMGVPVAAVKLKMSSENVNPDLLDDPDAEAPPGGNDVVPKEMSDDSTTDDYSD